MDSEDEYLQLATLHEPNLSTYKLLLTSLRNSHFPIFKSLLKRGLEKRPSSIDINYIYPHPLNKTLLEISCTEGLAEFAELLLELGADPNRINSSYNRGPLHFATESGHVNVLKVLLEDPRSNPNLEVARETALHLAIRKNNPECAKVLLNNNASPNIPNSKGLTPIHVAANSSNLEMVITILNNSRLPPNLDDFYDFRKKTARDLIADKFSEIKLPPKMDDSNKIDFNVLRFYLDANDEKNFLYQLKKLDEDGGDINEGNLLIIATEKNLISSVDVLMKRINYRENVTTINEAIEGAVKRGHVEILERLLNVGNRIGDNVILTAAKELGTPLQSNLNSEYRFKCLEMILQQPHVNVRCQDDKGNTPLHYAARAECSEAVTLLLKNGAFLGAKNVLSVPPLAHIPYGLLQNYFDDCLRSNNDRNDDYEIEFDYTCFMPNSCSDTKMAENSGGLSETSDQLLSKNSLCNELELFNYIANNRSLKNLLNHPLLSSFLYLKWHRIRHIFYANFIFYAFFYILLNSYVLVIFNSKSELSSEDEKAENFSESAIAEKIVLAKNLPPAFDSLWGMTTVTLIIMFLRELFQLISAPLHYLRNAENWWEMMLIIFTTIILFNRYSAIGAIIILLSAWELVIMIGQHPKMSTKIEIFKTVTINLLFFLLPYAFLILAFAMAFFTLFNDSDDDNFPNPGRSIFKTIIMLTGEFDANDIPFLRYPIISRFIFILFIFLIAIVLFNLLIGLAVSDTTDILSKSELVVLISRTKLINYSEKIVIGTRSMKSVLNYCRFWDTIRPKKYAISFLARKIFFFPFFIPAGKIYIRPYKNNLIRIVGNNFYETGCNKIFMEKKIVEKAKEILLEKGKLSENQKIMAELTEMRAKMDEILESINFVKSSFLNNNVNDNKD